ncbi:hypothetical protein FNV43_RR11526 [Rhamnella rubrinervis]|uniref:Uncharacterized protein n=1 Tax=Rhamnella rubrinervis TaxID=2594499 RepID=A0A8K0MHT6_9ROSA|nr:hypothetical protein FNV43_RR11526 [Rhamnella rubrinervis]
MIVGAKHLVTTPLNHDLRPSPEKQALEGELKPEQAGNKIPGIKMTVLDKPESLTNPGCNTKYLASFMGKAKTPHYITCECSREIPIFTTTTATSSFLEFDNVKAEKAIAMRRYRLQRNFKWLSEACVALFLLARSSAWFPIAIDFFRDFSRAFFGVFRSHLYVFVLFHAIIFLVYALSGKNSTDDKHHAAAGSAAPDLYDEFVNNSVCSRKNISTDCDASAPELRFQDKHVVFSKNVASDPPAPKTDTVRTENDRALVVKSHRRTQSEDYNEKKVEKSTQREFRRSDTELCREVKCSGEEQGRPSSSVDQMSTDDFNRTVEAFIASQKWIQREEYKEERGTEFQMSLTL